MNVELSPLQLDALAEMIVIKMESRGISAAPEAEAVTQEIAAGMIGCCTKTIRELRKAGALDTMFIGTSPRVTLTSIRAYKKREASQVPKKLKPGKNNGAQPDPAAPVTTE